MAARVQFCRHDTLACDVTTGTHVGQDTINNYKHICFIVGFMLQLRIQAHLHLFDGANVCLKMLQFNKMSSSSSSEVISESENSECSDFEQEMEEELMENTDQSKVGKYSSKCLSSSEEEYAYRNDLIADEEWTARYEAEMAEERNVDEMLMRRLNGSIPVNGNAF